MERTRTGELSGVEAEARDVGGGGGGAYGARARVSANWGSRRRWRTWSGAARVPGHLRSEHWARGRGAESKSARAEPSVVAARRGRAARWGRGAAELNEARRGGRPPLAGHCLIRCTVWRGGTGRGPKVKYRPGQECGAARQSPPAVEETVWVCSPELGAVHWLWAPDPGRVVPGGSLGSVFTYCFFLSMALRNALLGLCLKHLEQGRWPASFRPYPLQIPATSKPTPPRPSVSWKFGSYKISLQSAVK